MRLGQILKIPGKKSHAKTPSFSLKCSSSSILDNVHFTNQMFSVGHLLWIWTQLHIGLNKHIFWYLNFQQRNYFSANDLLKTFSKISNKL